MQLWERGLIDLHADINTYLPFEVRHPTYPDVSITTYMLLNHQSGLSRPEDDDNIPDSDALKALLDAEVLLRTDDPQSAVCLVSLREDQDARPQSA